MIREATRSKVLKCSFAENLKVFHNSGREINFCFRVLQQLLCLVLQILATLALDPAHHKPLLDAGIAEALPPLLLPADEFFYTNHTTLFARYVKHHAARVLVYLGLHHRSALRVSVFDLITSGWLMTITSSIIMLKLVHNIKLRYYF